MGLSNQSKNAPSSPLLAGIGLSKSFGRFVANRDIDFTIYPGELHALLGENGAGKSTFVKMILACYSQIAAILNGAGSRFSLLIRKKHALLASAWYFSISRYLKP